MFYPKYWAETVRKGLRYAGMFYDGYRIYRSVERNPAKGAYTDLAIAPPSADELETLEMFSVTSGVKAAVAKKQRDDDQRARLTRLQATT